MIVEAKVIRSFKHSNTGLIWFDGDTFRGTHDAAVQLAERGYLDFDGAEPQPEEPSLATLTVRELAAMCAERGIDVPARAKKADLIAAIEAAGKE